jgi:hypothetical protein
MAGKTFTANAALCGKGLFLMGLTNVKEYWKGTLLWKKSRA